jgi:hypothetical protein
VLRATAPAGLKIAANPVPLSDVEEAWPRDDSARRTVFTTSAIIPAPLAILANA